MTNTRHKSFRILSTALFIALLTMVVSMPDALAGKHGSKHGRPHTEARESSRHGERRWSLDSAVSRIRERTDGRVLSAETREKDGRFMHRIKILTPEGHIRQFRVDPRTGEVER